MKPEILHEMTMAKHALGFRQTRLAEIHLMAAIELAGDDSVTAAKLAAMLERLRH